MANCPSKEIMRTYIPKQKQIKNCKTCGKVIYGFSRKLYCSSNCTKRRITRDTIKCSYCDIEIIAPRSNQRFCSRDCKQRAKYKRTYEYSEVTKECVNCGKEFVARRKSAKYCSYWCSNHSRWLKVRKQEVQHCQRCSAEIGYHKGSKWCPDCKKVVDLERNRMPKKAAACRKCGTVFMSDGRQKFCNKCKTTRLENFLDYIRQANQKRRSKKAGVEVGFKHSDWNRALEYFNHKCVYCGASGRMHQDHFVPLAKGGAYTKKNIVPACQSCNSKKGDSDPREWLSPAKYWQLVLYLKSA